MGIGAALYSVAYKENIKHILSGQSFRTEGIRPIAWAYFNGDHLRAIQKRFGRVYTLEGNIDSAKYYFEEAAKLPNTFPQVYLNLIAIYNTVHDTSGLLYCYSHLAKIDSNNQTHLQKYYQLQMTQANYNEALKAVTESYSRTPDSPPVLVALGDTYAKLGKNDSAALFYLKAYDINGDSNLRKIADELMKSESSSKSS